MMLTIVEPVLLCLALELDQHAALGNAPIWIPTLYIAEPA